MRLTSFVVWKTWASEPLRTALTLCGIAVGVAVVVAIHVVDHNTVQSQIRRKNPDFGRVDLEVVPLQRDRQPRDVLAELGAVSGVEEVGVMRSVRVEAGLAAAADGLAPAAEMQLHGIAPLRDPVRGTRDIGSTRFEHYRVVEGRDLNAVDGDDAVLVGARFAAETGVEVGSRMTLQAVRAPRIGPCIDGVRRAPPADDVVARTPERREVEVVGLLAHERLARRNFGAVLVGSYALARALDADAERPGRSVYQVDLAYGVDPDRVRRALAAAYEVRDGRSALLGESADERAFRNGVKILGGLALVLGMFVVFQTLSHGLVERLRQLGILRALGTGRAALAGIFLVDALALGLLGSLVGVLLGIGLAWTMAANGLTTLGLGKEVTTFELPAAAILWTAGVGVVFTLAGAAFPLWKVRNLPVQRILGSRGLGAGEEGGYVLRGVHKFLFALLVVVLPVAYLAMTPLLTGEGSRETLLVLGQVYVLALVFGGLLLLAPRLVSGMAGPLLWLVGRLRGFRLAAFLVGRSVRGDTGRFAASMCGLAVVLLAWIGLQGITDALVGDVRRFAGETLQGRVFGRVDPTAAGRLRALGELPEAARVVPLRGPVEVPFPVHGVDLDDVVAAGVFDGLGPGAARDYEAERTLLVSRRLAYLRDLAPGHLVPMRTDAGPVAYRVLAVSDGVGFFPDERAWAAVAPRWLEKDFCVPSDLEVTRFVAWAPSADDAGVADVQRAEFALRNALRDARPDMGWSKTGAQIADYWERDVDKDFVVFHVLLGLILVLAGVGLMNQMTLAALGRAREIGVLRALAVGRTSLRRVFVLEAAVVACGATLVAWVAGPGLGYLIVRGLGVVAGLDARFVMPWTMMATVPLLAVVVALPAAWLPGTRALRIAPADAVRYP